MTDNSQQVVWQAENDPFGDAVETAALLEQNLRFPGQFFDNETGLHYNYFRTYDASIGRYTRNDPGLDVLNPQNYPISPNVAQALNKFNDHIGRRYDIVITGGDRPSTSPIGARSGSQHAQGTAADIYVPGIFHNEVANAALECGLFTGVGWYEEGYRGSRGEGPHVHVDLRQQPGKTPTNPAKWGHPAGYNTPAGPIPPYTGTPNLNKGQPSVGP